MKLERVTPTIIRGTEKRVFLYPEELEVNLAWTSTKLRYKLRRGDIGPDTSEDPGYRDMHIFLRTKPMSVTVEG